MEANADGVVETIIEDAEVGLFGPRSVIGRSIIVHGRAEAEAGG